VDLRWRICSSFHRVPSRDTRVAVLCASSTGPIFSPVFLYGTVNWGRYVQGILEHFFEQLSDEEEIMWLSQQDGATIHTADSSVRAL
jgi:hypothetical protein